MTSNYTVTVLGLGAMGLPMATRLASQLTVHGFDIAEPRLKLAQEAGIATFTTAREAAKGANAVLLAVRNGEQLNDVLFGENGVASVLEPGAVVILGSTVGTDAIPGTVAKLAEFGVDLVDAPLSGGPKRAGEGDLLIVVGASPEARAKAAPALDLLASTLTVVGDNPGDGQALKTVNQLLCGVHIVVAAEALSLAERVGVDTARMLEILTETSAGSWMLRDRGPRMLQAEPEVTSAVDIFVKDLGIVLEAGRETKAALPLTALAFQLFNATSGRGDGAADDSQVIRAFRALNGAI
jgi:3-hydroxyisobutyrate dehydrogenase